MEAGALVVKTYLSPEDQWQRTVAYYSPFADNKVGANPYRQFAVIVLPGRLWNVGDCFIEDLRNGQAQRQPLFGVSSKGYKIAGKYTAHQRFRMWKMPKSRANTYETHDSGPARYVEFPGHLTGLLLSDPAVQRYVVEAARVLLAARRVGAGSPTFPNHWRREVDVEEEEEKALLLERWKKRICLCSVKNHHYGCVHHQQT